MTEDLKIIQLSQYEYDDYIIFNRKIYPERNDIEKRFKFIFIDNPFVKDKEKPDCYIAKSGSEIIGQVKLLRQAFLLNDDIQDCYFGCDFYVNGINRKGGLGGFLAVKAINEHQPHFAIGTSDIAEKIHLALKEKNIGHLYKFLYFSSIKGICKYFLINRLNFKSKESKTEVIFPEEIFIEKKKFSKAKVDDNINYSFRSNNLVEFLRNTDFIKWRYFSFKDKYHLYYMKGDIDSPAIWFVCRITKWKGLNILVLVDYRACFRNNTDFKRIIKAVKKVAGMNKLDGIFTTSSLKNSDKILSHNAFIKIGSLNILTNAKINYDEDKINKRDFILATMADSDYDFNFANDFL